jgi:heme-degrading monooxygenase HmoA
MTYVIAKCPCHEEGGSKLIDWANSNDGLSVTRTHKGFKHIELLVDEDNKTIYLYEQWDSKEDHQTYLNFRIENGFDGPLLNPTVRISILSCYLHQPKVRCA